MSDKKGHGKESGGKRHCSMGLEFGRNQER